MLLLLSLIDLIISFLSIIFLISSFQRFFRTCVTCTKYATFFHNLYFPLSIHDCRYASYLIKGWFHSVSFLGLGVRVFVKHDDA